MEGPRPRLKPKIMDSVIRHSAWVVEVFEAGKEKVTYVKMTAEKAQRVITDHLKGGKVVTEYTIAAYAK